MLLSITLTPFILKGSYCASCRVRGGRKASSIIKSVGGHYRWYTKLMDGFITIVGINIAAIFVFYILFGTEAQRYKKRLNEVKTMLRTKKSPYAEGYEYVLSKARMYGQLYFWLGFIGLLVILDVGFSIYASSVEREASLNEWITISAIMYGVGLLGSSIVVSIAATRIYQLVMVMKFIDTVPVDPATSNEIAKVLKFRRGEIGTLTLTVSAIIGSVVLGVAYLVVFFLAAQTAIECARSSKCM